MVSPDSQGTACPSSGRNSTYRPVQISGTGSNGQSIQPKPGIRAFQAVPLSKCPEPPFHITASFRNSFKKAVEKYRVSKIVDNPNLEPKAALLKYIDQFERRRT